MEKGLEISQGADGEWNVRWYSPLLSGGSREGPLGDCYEVVFAIDPDDGWVVTPQEARAIAQLILDNVPPPPDPNPRYMLDVSWRDGEWTWILVHEGPEGPVRDGAGTGPTVSACIDAGVEIAKMKTTPERLVLHVDETGAPDVADDVEA